MIRTSLAILLFSIVLSMPVVAQTAITVSVTRATMSQGTNEGFKVEIPEATAKDVERLWKKECKDYKGKVSTPKGEIIADDATIGKISANTIDIYAKVDAGQKGGATLTVFYDLGGAYIGAGHASEPVVTKMLHRFAVDAAKDAVAMQVSAEEKKLKDLEREQERLTKDKEQLERDVEKFKKEIEKAKASIEGNISDQKSNQALIETQGKAVKAAQSKLKAIK